MAGAMVDTTDEPVGHCQFATKNFDGIAIPIRYLPIEAVRQIQTYFETGIFFEQTSPCTQQGVGAQWDGKSS